jgi:PIN domain nuclease of toxin-antitoxin system
VRYLFDTHLLLWAAATPDRLPPPARSLLDDAANDAIFSVASIWEVAIKRGIGRADFRVDPRLLRHALLGAGYRELPIAGDHVAAVDTLPPIHKDPFDRLLVAQAILDDLILVTADPVLSRYNGPVTLV